MARALDPIASGEVKSLSAASREFGPHRTAIARRLNGGLSIAEANEQAQLLSKSEEDALFL